MPAAGSPRIACARRCTALQPAAATLVLGAVAAFAAWAAPDQAAAATTAAATTAVRAAPAACADERSCVVRVLELENERLAIMPAVAAWKWRHHAAVSDPARERVVIAQSAKLARPLGLAGAPIEHLFALQIRLARDVETASEANWRERGFDDSQPDLDLARDLRPRIDRLTQQLLSTLAAAAPAFSRADFAVSYAADAERLLRAQGWTAASRHELLAALGAVRVVTATGPALPAAGPTRPAADPAQPAAAPAGPAAAHSTRLILLGTNGGPVVNASRSEPANLLIVDGKAYLIDAGSGTVRQLTAANFRPERIRTIFITHHHIDHDAGLPSLLAEIWFAKAWGHIQSPPTQVYGPPATRFLVHAALDYLSVSERIFRAGVPALARASAMFEAHDIDHDGLVLDDGTVRVTAAENTHFHFKSSSPETGRDRSYSYRFDTPAGSIVFTGDTGPSEAVARLANGADVLVSEVCAVCSPSALAARQRTQPPSQLAAQQRFHMLHEHLTPEDVGEMAARAHVKVLILTHLAPSAPGTDMTIFTAGIAKHFAGTVIPGRDLLEYDLNAPAGAPRR